MNIEPESLNQFWRTYGRLLEEMTSLVSDKEGEERGPRRERINIYKT